MRIKDNAAYIKRLRARLKREERDSGLNHPRLAKTLDELGSSLCYDEHYAEAEASLLRSLALREETFGEDHLDLVETLRHLALLYRTTDRVDAAEAMLNRALTIHAEAADKARADHACTLERLAYLRLAQGQTEEAEMLYKTAFLSLKARPLPTDTITPNCVIALLFSTRIRDVLPKPNPNCKRRLRLPSRQLK